MSPIARQVHSEARDSGELEDWLLVSSESALRPPILDGFKKKSRRTPTSDVSLARQRKNKLEDDS